MDFVCKVKIISTVDFQCSASTTNNFFLGIFFIFYLMTQKCEIPLTKFISVQLHYAFKQNRIEVRVSRIWK